MSRLFLRFIGNGSLVGLLNLLSNLFRCELINDPVVGENFIRAEYPTP